MQSHRGKYVPRENVPLTAEMREWIAEWRTIPSIQWRLRDSWYTEETLAQDIAFVHLRQLGEASDQRRQNILAVLTDVDEDTTVNQIARMLLRTETEMEFAYSRRLEQYFDMSGADYNTIAVLYDSFFADPIVKKLVIEAALYTFQSLAEETFIILKLSSDDTLSFPFDANSAKDMHLERVMHRQALRGKVQEWQDTLKLIRERMQRNEPIHNELGMEENQKKAMAMMLLDLDDLSWE